MSETSNPALAIPTDDVVAEMRKRLLESSLKTGSASLLRKAPGKSPNPQPTPEQVAPPAPAHAVYKASKSIFDPFSNAAPVAAPAAQVVQAVPVSTPAQVATTAAPPQVNAATRATIAPATTATAIPAQQGAEKAPAIAKARSAPKRYSAGVYASVCAFAALLGLGAVYNANIQFAGEMYGEKPLSSAVEAFTQGKNYATFDLNINIRQLRDKQLARMEKMPDVILLGASHWQEANEHLVTNQDMYNSHIHRDYWEDLFAMINILERNNKLPKKLIISLRDNQFMAMENRRDFLWEPGIPYWREQAAKMNIPSEPYWKSLGWQRIKEKLSLRLLFLNMSRWFKAEELPHITDKDKYDTLDILLPGGSIIWSRQHDAYFTQERSKQESLTFAAFKVRNPPSWEEKGVKNFETLVEYIQSKGTKLYFAHPPFNPIYWDAVQNTEYAEKLSAFEAMVGDIAKRHNIETIGSFNPYKVGCKAEQYIDAEHANSTCLANIFNQWMALDAKNSKVN